MIDYLDYLLRPIDGLILLLVLVIVIIITSIVFSSLIIKLLFYRKPEAKYSGINFFALAVLGTIFYAIFYSAITRTLFSLLLIDNPGGSMGLLALGVASIFLLRYSAFFVFCFYIYAILRYNKNLALFPILSKFKRVLLKYKKLIMIVVVSFILLTIIDYTYNKNRFTLAVAEYSALQEFDNRFLIEKPQKLYSVNEDNLRKLYELESSIYSEDNLHKLYELESSIYSEDNLHKLYELGNYYDESSYFTDKSELEEQKRLIFETNKAEKINYCQLTLIKSLDMECLDLILGTSLIPEINDNSIHNGFMGDYYNRYRIFDWFYKYDKKGRAELKRIEKLLRESAPEIQNLRFRYGRFKKDLRLDNSGSKYYLSVVEHGKRPRYGLEDISQFLFGAHIPRSSAGSTYVLINITENRLEHVLRLPENVDLNGFGDFDGDGYDELLYSVVTHSGKYPSHRTNFHTKHNFLGATLYLLNFSSNLIQP